MEIVIDKEEEDGENVKESRELVDGAVQVRHVMVAVPQTVNVVTLLTIPRAVHLGNKDSDSDMD